LNLGIPAASISPLAFASIRLYAASAKGFPEPPLADKPPGRASVKGTHVCDTGALENLNRLDYISRVTATGVKADKS
jgi:hypothetical protein